MARAVLGAGAVAQRKHQERALGIIAGLEGGQVRAELSVPQASRHIDGVVVLGDASEGWGPIRSLVQQRTLVVEHFSRPPPLIEWTRSIAKLAWVVDDWWRAGPGNSTRPPLLLVVSCGRPRKALSLLPQLRELELPEIWHERRPLLGDVVLVDIRNLPSDRPGTSVLRLMAIPRSAAEARTNINALLDDPDLVESTKRHLLEIIMDPTIPSTDEEHLTIVERLLAQGRREGIGQGRRGALLRAASVLGEAEVTQLSGISDTDELERRVMALLARLRDRG